MSPGGVTCPSHGTWKRLQVSNVSVIGGKSQEHIESGLPSNSAERVGCAGVLPIAKIARAPAVGDSDDVLHFYLHKPWPEW
jgi:hypothetical protein